ncbi:Voltage-dependent N-type calcium channel subunit alpha-1B [Manis javanica]|nr:Voltage-dependent N-type calcium channel subunit alpha-1B [Manis javanica]
MVMQAPCAVPAASNDEVAELFQAGQQLHAIAVVEAGRPLALINRQQFMNHYATLYFREVHGRKPCLAFANVQPRIVELDCDVDQLVGILTSQDQRYLSDGFIVTDNGRYVGLGTGEQLVRRVTEARIEAARHANPLTFLPGNIPISLHMQRLLDSGAGFVACYADLNHFKPFNDHYGYWRGDQMIRLVARLAVGHCDARRDFVGHVGGDDFMLLLQSEDWQRRCEGIGRLRQRGAPAVRRPGARGRRHLGRGPPRHPAILCLHYAVHRRGARHAGQHAGTRGHRQPRGPGQAAGQGAKPAGARRHRAAHAAR